MKIVVPLAGMIFGLVYAFRPQASRERREQPKPAVGTASAAGWPPDPDLKRAMTLVNGTDTNSADFSLAAEIEQKTLAKNSTDPEAVTVMARAQVSFLYRSFDLSEETEMSAVEGKAFTPSNASRGR